MSCIRRALKPLVIEAAHDKQNASKKFDAKLAS